MPDDAVEPREHYVYALFREDGVTPFYIGMGKAKKAKAMRGRKGTPHTPESKEKLRQANLGKKMPDHVREILRKCGNPPAPTAASRAKAGAKLRGRKQSPEAIEKRRLAMLGKKHSEETLAKMRGRIRTDEHRAKLSEAMRRKWADEEFRERQSAAVSEAMNRPDGLEATKARLKEYWRRQNTDPENDMLSQPQPK